MQSAHLLLLIIINFTVRGIMDENVISSPKKLISAQPLVFNISELFMSQKARKLCCNWEYASHKSAKVRGSGTAVVIILLIACISAEKIP